MSEIVVVAEIGILPERRAEALVALEELCTQTHAKDDGCLLYALQLDPADESHVFMIEKWESPEALQAHGGSDHIRAFGGAGLVSGPPTVTVLTQARYGDGEKGAV
jgi:quinol monooxygenase YgiN